jgi:NADH-quinone oxidoreductase subunit L
VLEHLYLIPALPLASLLVNLALGERMGERGVGLVACAGPIAAFFVAAGAFVELLRLPPESRHAVQTLWTWMASGNFRVDVTLLFDPLSAVMCLVVTFVGSLIHVYSTGYMHGDGGYRRYFVNLNLFTFAMLILVLAESFLLLFVGWEGVGLCSYLLIGHWYERHTAANAARKAFVVNRIGDFGFLLAMLLLATQLGSLHFGEVFERAPRLLAAGGGVATAAALLLFLGAAGKSAQLPLHVWLPDAMEGPTPVSALIHAATMVTAGVYMVARCHVLFELAPAALAVVAAIGAATALFAATIGLAQNDIKRVLAYSTVSQLGYMFLALGVGAYAAGIFHLTTHAFFKALLFLGAGSVIHALAGEQDLRRMGGLKASLPWTHAVMLVGCLAIAGIPPLAGFFSKDAILSASFFAGRPVLYGIGLLTAGLTAFYMFRLYYLAFHGAERMAPEARHHLHESPRSMVAPLVVLAAGSAVAGFLSVPLVPEGDRLGSFLGPVLGDGASLADFGVSPGAAHAAHPPLGIELALVAASVAAAALGIAVAHRLYVAAPGAAEALARRAAAAYRTLLNKYYVDEIYAVLVVRPLERLAGWFWRIFDVRVIDGLVDGTGGAIAAAGAILRLFQNGYVGTYAFFFVIGVLFLLARLVL